MELRPGVYRYRTTSSMGEKQTVMLNSTSIEETEEGWSVTESTEMAHATLSTASILEKDTLFLRKLTMTGGPVRCDVEFRDGHARGLLQVSMQPDRVIDCRLGEELFANGAGMAQSLAALPLAEGYTKTLRLFAIARQTVTEKQLTVAAMEGNVFKIEIAPGPWTLWIDRDSRTLLRSAMAMSHGMSSASELVVA